LGISKETSEFENPKASDQHYLFGLYNIHDYLYQTRT
jgi:hypothetical protein